MMQWLMGIGLYPIYFIIFFTIFTNVFYGNGVYDRLPSSSQDIVIGICFLGSITTWICMVSNF